LRAQLAAIAAGRDPVGAGAGASDQPIPLDAGNFLES
jgi:hypothetical protein